MEAVLMNAAISFAPQQCTRLCSNWKSIHHSVVCCVGKSGESKGLSRGPSQKELESRTDIGTQKGRLQSVEYESEKNQNQIWQLFREAQQNILLLNKQCLVAMEELDEMRREQQALLDKIEQLENKSRALTEEDRLSIFSELLLRIDSMVLTGILDVGEAPGLRSLVMDSKVSVADNLTDLQHKSDAEILAELHHFADKQKRNGFHIIHICTEMDPIICVGSLASYVTGLSRALQRKGNLVEVFLPKYSSLHLDKVKGLRETGAEFYSYFNGQLHTNRIWTGVIYGIGVTFIEPVQYSAFFSSERIYGQSNDFERFSYFSRASLDYIIKTGKQPDVLHIHNWETSIVAPLFWDVFFNKGLGATRILLTCQSLDSQCTEQPDKLALCGLDPSQLQRPDRFQDNSSTHLVNILKGGIVYSNKVIIMTKMHSKGKNMRTSSYGLEPTLAIHKDKLLISPFGLDNSTWDPSHDKFLPQKYDADDMRGKAVCKVALQQHLGLAADASIILVGCIISEASDVDVENLKRLAWITTKRSAQILFVELSEIPAIKGELEPFQDDIMDKNVRFLNKCDEALSHLVFSGSDIIMCSFDDPTLHVPLKATKYGAAPLPLNFVERRFSSFIDRDSQSTNFAELINNTFLNVSLSQALDEIKNSPLEWNRKIKDAMMKDFSWDAECCEIHVSAYTSIKNR